MAEAMVDSLRIYERLKATRGKDALAREIAGVFGELVDSKLATKRDIEGLRSATQKDIEGLRAETKLHIESLRAETERLRVELKADIDHMRISTEARIDGRGLEVKHDLIRWVAGMLLAQAGLIAALVKLA